MISVPPELAGAVQVTVTALFDGVMAMPVGDPGTNPGAMGAVGLEAGPSPSALVAVTVNV